MSWYKKALENPLEPEFLVLDNKWTDEEEDFLREASERFLNTSLMQKGVNIERNVITDTYVGFKVSVRREPDASYSRKLYVEKEGASLYEVNQDDNGFRTIENFKDIEVIVDNFISEIR
jgi:hypothetical protein